MWRLTCLVLLSGCGAMTTQGPVDAGKPLVDAGSLGPNVSCQAALIGGATGNFGCEVNTVFVRGAPNNSTVTITANSRDRSPEVTVSVRVPLELEAGKSYSWADDLLAGEVIVTDVPRGNTFLASKGQGVDPVSFTFRVEQVPGRVATANGGAQLRFLGKLEATLRPTVDSSAVNNARVTLTISY
jgi:hypothetical protein